MTRAFLLTFLILTIGLKFLNGQGLELETLPASTKWSQINTDNFRIIFQNGFESEANRTANILETIHDPASRSLGVKPRKFSVLLQNQQAISNGFVTIGPRRSEFYTSSPQDNKQLGNVDWMQHLAVHEYRHMVQFEKAYQSTINKLAYVAFGEYGVGFNGGIAAPSWFWEGDAVGTETAFTRTGRGRTPNFELEFKTNLLEKGGFNYYKQHLTSFKDFVPNHYRTGYFMTTHLKRKFGVDIWDKIVKRSFSFPYLPFVFSNAIKKETGKNLLQTYEEMTTEMAESYEKQVIGLKEDQKQVINKRTNQIFTNYHYPSILGDGKILALKSGFSDIEKFVTIDNNGNEVVVFTTGIINDPGYLSVNDDKIVWTEFEFDPRWLKKTYSVIKTFDYQTHRFRRITKKSKYQSAAISPDGSKIVSIKNSEQNQYTVELMDYATGETIQVFDNPENAYYSMPSFSQDGKFLVILKSSHSGKSIIKKEITKGNEQVLIQTEAENFGHPILTNTYLFYNSPLNGIDNIYALDLTSNQVYQVTHAKLGAYNPSISADGKVLYYNEFSRDGMDVVKIEIDKTKWTKLENIVDRNINFAEPMAEEEGHMELMQNISSSQYQATPFRKLPHVLRPHSWGLSAVPTNNSLILGINSQDLLSTTTISAGLRFDSDESNWLKFGSISYQGLYPIVDVSVVDGTRSVVARTENGPQPFNWNETSLSAGLRVPLILTNSKYLRKLSLSSRAVLTSVSGFNLPDRFLIDQAGNGSHRALEHSITFVNNLRRSKLDLNSRFGQSLRVSLKHTPIGGDYHSALLAAESNLFFPGLTRHHSIRLRGSFQNEDSDNYYFDSPIRFTRGVGYFPFLYYTNWSFNYKMPLWYPDIHIGPLLNVQRVYINGFVDRGWGDFAQPGEPHASFESYGAELSFNFNLMRFLLIFDVGIRYSYVPEFNESRTELIVGSISF
ncbi:MAG: hypothetical protein JXQ96_06055 [Cyclobacteriaceae bacterium]